MIQNANLLQSFLLILYLYENKYYLQGCLYNCGYKIINKRMIDFLGENPFETDED